VLLRILVKQLLITPSIIHSQPTGFISPGMTRFRPCIDLHSGQVKQIVGGTLGLNESDLRTNHISIHPASHFANLYRDHDCAGAHVIMLGPGNEEAAREALAAWPGGLQIGGGITDQNAGDWIERGAEKVTTPTAMAFCATRVSLPSHTDGHGP
jgi:phosphoribosylformimino-5-aminoimidazole carboxamide ribotide isomerase